MQFRMIALPKTPSIIPNDSLLWIGILLLALAAGLALLVILWYRRVQQTLRETNLHLRHFMTESNRIKIATREYSVDDQEPFGPQVEELLRQLGALENQVAELHQQYGEIQTSMHAFESRNWFVILSSPLRWYRIQRNLAVLRKTILNSLAVLKVTEELADRLTKQGWKVAQQARQVLDESRQIKTAMFHLRRKHMRGKTIEAAFEMDRQLHDSLGQIPVYFFSADEDTFIRQATKSDITRTFQILKNAHATIVDLRSKAQDWEQTHSKAFNRATDLQQPISEMKKTLKEAPSGLDLAALATQVTALDASYKSLVKDFASPEADNLPTLSRQAQKLQREVRETNRWLSRTLKQSADLETTLARLESNLEKLSLRFTELETNPEYPILWGKNRQVLQRLKGQMKDIHQNPTETSSRYNVEIPAQKIRTPEQVEADLAAALGLETQLETLTKTLERIGEQRIDLIGLLASPTLQQSAEWFRNAQALAVQTTVFDPDNWPQPASAGSLMEEIQSLQTFQADLLPISKSIPLEESALPILLEKTRHYVKNYLALRSRVKDIQGRWIAIQKNENAARSDLSSLKAMLNQLDRFLSTNPTLWQVASSEAEQLKTKANQLSEALNQRNQGMVAKKSGEVNALVVKTHQAAGLWLSKMQLENEANEKVIASKVEALEEIANLDEAAIFEVDKLFTHLEEEQLWQTAPVPQGRKAIQGRSRGRSPTIAQVDRGRQALSSPGKSVPTSGGLKKVEITGESAEVSLSRLFGELKRVSQDWQKLSSILHALEDLEKPILSVYTKTQQKRENARLKIANVAQLIPETPGWPPTSASLQLESHQFEQLEAQWNAMQDEPTKAIWLVSKLSELGGKYQALAEKAQQIAAQTEQDQEKIRTLEGEIVHTIQAWQNKAEQDSEDPITQDRIHQMILRSSDELNALKKDYRKGLQTYDQVLQSLYALLGRVKNASIDNE
jgi:chromosome segregation ATPase